MSLRRRKINRSAKKKKKEKHQRDVIPVGKVRLDTLLPILQISLTVKTRLQGFLHITSLLLLDYWLFHRSGAYRESNQWMREPFLISLSNNVDIAPNSPFKGEEILLQSMSERRFGCSVGFMSFCCLSPWRNSLGQWFSKWGLRQRNLRHL